MPLRVTPEQAAENWVRGVANGQAKMEAGIDRVTESPGAKAAAAADKWLASVSQARDRFASGARATSLEDWRGATKAAIANVASGAQRKQGKYTQKITPVFAHLAGVVATVDRMPSTTYEQRRQRAIAMMDGMHNYKR